MSHAIGWLRKDKLPFKKYVLKKSKNKLIMYFDAFGVLKHKVKFIVIDLEIFDIMKYNSIDDLVYFKTVESYKKLGV